MALHTYRRPYQAQTENANDPVTTEHGNRLNRTETHRTNGIDKYAYQCGILILVMIQTRDDPNVIIQTSSFKGAYH